MKLARAKQRKTNKRKNRWLPDETSKKALNPMAPRDKDGRHPRDRKGKIKRIQRPFIMLPAQRSVDIAKPKKKVKVKVGALISSKGTHGIFESNVGPIRKPL